MLAVLCVGNGAAQAQSGAESEWLWDPFIAIVYPEGGPSNLAQSTKVNISVWPGYGGPCDQRPVSFDLFVAKDNEPMQPVATSEQGEFMLRRDGDHWFPSIEFNNVPADLRSSPRSQYRFLADRHFWVHAADARTYYPDPVVPTGYAEGTPQSLDVRIQVVWPHDGQGHPVPVERARYVNVAVELFEHDTLKALRSFPADQILLFGALGTEGMIPMIQLAWKSLEVVNPAQVVTYEANGTSYPRYVFNNIAVEPGQPYHFTVRLFGPEPARRLEGGSMLRFYSNIWTHAADARTYLPNPQPPKYGTEAFNTAAAYRCTDQ
ncbi:MAG TPA: hypothetical protein PLJ35_20070 [Anaerolineae bacterium]|nr:hypothetical protein [Anaerolineae bacterium]HOR01118.1 hypothetical protein [Anaerolineae bacterium]HPL28299.1 hypothetical protein [Anaerolineae bacterium]